MHCESNDKHTWKTPTGFLIVMGHQRLQTTRPLTLSHPLMHLGNKRKPMLLLLLLLLILCVVIVIVIVVNVMLSNGGIV